MGGTAGVEELRAAVGKAGLGFRVSASDIAGVGLRIEGFMRL